MGRAARKSEDGVMPEAPSQKPSPIRSLVFFIGPVCRLRRSLIRQPYRFLQLCPREQPRPRKADFQVLRLLGRPVEIKVERFAVHSNVVIALIEGSDGEARPRCFSSAEELAPTGPAGHGKSSETRTRTAGTLAHSSVSSG